MTRSLFFLTALAAMVMAMTGLVIRYELASPGVSALFLSETGTVDPHRFEVIGLTHTLFAYLAVILLGTTMCAAARAEGARWTGLPMILGGVCATAILGVISAGAIPLDAETSLLSQLMTTLGFEPLLIEQLTPFLLLPAGALLIFGAYAMTATLPGLGWMTYLGFGLVAIIAALVVSNGLTGLPLASFNLAIFPLIIVLSVHLIDRATPWVMILCIGLIAVTLAQFLLPSSWYRFGGFAPQVGRLALYVFPLGLAWFALPALLAYTSHTRLSGGAAAGVSFVIAVTLLLWLPPAFTLAHLGQPSGYMDYPEAFASLNRDVSLGVAVFGMAFLGVLILTRRASPKGRA